MAGTFTCNERVVRNGVLIAYEGQVMSMEQAERLGIAAKSAAEKAKSRAELAAEAEAMGLKVTSKMKVDAIKRMIAEAE